MNADLFRGGGHRYFADRHYGGLSATVDTVLLARAQTALARATATHAQEGKATAKGRQAFGDVAFIRNAMRRLLAGTGLGPSAKARLIALAEAA